MDIKWQPVPILVVSAAVSLMTTMGLGTKALLLYTGWTLVLSAAVSLVLYRLMLSHYDHQARGVGMGNTYPLHRWFARRETVVDRIGIPMAVGALIYTAAVVLFAVSQIFDEAIRKTMTLFSLH